MTNFYDEDLEQDGIFENQQQNDDGLLKSNTNFFCIHECVCLKVSVNIKRSRQT